MNKTTSQIRVNELIPMLTAIGDRNWERFKEVENQFVAIHGVEAWEDFFALRLKPALDKESDRWLLQMWCSEGIISVKNVA
ncbi:hypothetical protein H6G81_28730 [Scytonema hofmannii FACHB-248]|uniref:Uncharacterized protein n=1 Tax=Scytonema hofmannii FACHB-248 TaxID=1842502 RepID=A0ABR8GXX5_9CYAN|nr:MULTISPECIES: hypothetical protein [Nostocales]MBD2608396.1 hypothetical protein [Scytonema hofmannii FACHB-248]